MRDARTIANDYIALWNEANPALRQSALEAGWATDAVYVDPVMGGSGRQEIDGLIAAVHTRFPGFIFTLINEPNGHNDFVRFARSLGPAGEPAPIEGSDVLVMQGDRIGKVIGFLDKLPQ